jgi:hypothetical protein
MAGLAAIWAAQQRDSPVSSTPAAAPPMGALQSSNLGKCRPRPTHRAISIGPIDRYLLSQVPPAHLQQGHCSQLHEGPEGVWVCPVRLGQIRQPSLVQAYGRLKEQQWIEALSIDGGQGSGPRASDLCRLLEQASHPAAHHVRVYGQCDSGQQRCRHGSFGVSSRHYRCPCCRLQLTESLREQCQPGPPIRILLSRRF